MSDIPLIAAAQSGQADQLERMIANGANLYECDHLNGAKTNAFRAAVDANSRDCVRALLDAGYDPYKSIRNASDTDLAYANTSKNMMLVDMVRQAALKFELIQAAIAVKIDRCVELLRDKNTDIHLKDGRGLDALHHVVANPSCKHHPQATYVVDELLARGANPNGRCAPQPTTMYHAIVCGNTDFTRQLIAAGGKVRGCQHMGATDPLMDYLVRSFQPNHEILDVVSVQLQSEAATKNINGQERIVLIRPIKIKRGLTP